VCGFILYEWKTFQMLMNSWLKFKWHCTRPNLVKISYFDKLWNLHILVQYFVASYKHHFAMYNTSKKMGFDWSLMWCGNLSFKVIQELTLSPNLLKTHWRTIHGKLWRNWRQMIPMKMVQNKPHCNVMVLGQLKSINGH